MRKTTSKKSRYVMSFVSLFVMTAFLGCASGQRKSTTTANGKTTVYGDAETIKKAQQKQETAPAWIENFRKAEKRKPTDPIVVALFSPIFLGAKIQESLDQAKLYQQLRKEFEQDSIIRLVDQYIIDALQTPIKQGPSRKRKKRPDLVADVSVNTTVSLEQVAKKSRAANKAGMMSNIVFGGQISSYYMPADCFKAVEQGNISQNVQVTKKYAAQVIEIIKTKVTIPGEAYKKYVQDLHDKNQVKKNSGKRDIKFEVFKNRIKLSWHHPIKAETFRYYIYMRTSQGKYKRLNRKPTRKTSFMTKTLKSKHTYIFTVKIVDAGGRIRQHTKPLKVSLP